MTRLSTVNLKLNIINKFLVSPNCFIPVQNWDSTVIHFKQIRILLKLSVKNLESDTNIIFK